MKGIIFLVCFSFLRGLQSVAEYMHIYTVVSMIL